MNSIPSSHVLPHISPRMSAAVRKAVEIPVIDISATNDNAASELVDAASKYGFVFIKNNDAGIAPGKISQMFDLVSTKVQIIHGISADA